MSLKLEKSQNYYAIGSSSLVYSNSEYRKVIKIAETVAEELWAYAITGSRVFMGIRDKRKHMINSISMNKLSFSWKEKVAEQNEGKDIQVLLFDIFGNKSEPKNRATTIKKPNKENKRMNNYWIKKRLSLNTSPNANRR